MVQLTVGGEKFSLTILGLTIIGHPLKIILSQGLLRLGGKSQISSQRLFDIMNGIFAKENAYTITDKFVCKISVNLSLFLLIFEKHPAILYVRR